MKYKEYYVKITPDKSIRIVDKKGEDVLCEGFLIQIFADESEQAEIDNFTAAVGFEIIENSLAEAEQLAKDYIDSEKLELNEMSDEGKLKPQICN